MTHWHGPSAKEPHGYEPVTLASLTNPATLPLREGVPDVAGAVAEAADSLASVEADLPLMDKVRALQAAASNLAAVAVRLEELALFEDAMRPMEIPAAQPGATAGERIRDLREALGLTQQELAEVSAIGESTLWAIENGARPVGRKVVVCVAHGLAQVAHPGQIDPDTLFEEVAAAMDREGLLSGPGDYDQDWIARRLRRVHGVHGETVRRRIAFRRVYGV